MSDQISRRQMVAQLTAAAATVSATANATCHGSEPIKIGQIGIGHAHSTKLSVYRSSPDYQVVGLVESDPELRKQIPSNGAFKDVPLMTEEQLLNVPGLQAVLVETHIEQLLPTAEKCVNAGLHVHIDKPAGDSMPHFRRVVESARQKQRLIQMGYMYRYNPAVVLLQEFLKKGWLGDIFEVHTVMSKVMPADLRGEIAKYSGGTMFELGCHIIDLVVGVCGKPTNVTSVSQHVSTIQDNLQDNMLALLEYPNTIATVKSTAVEVEGFARRHFVVCGTEGTFHIQPLDNPSARIALSQPRGDYKKGYQDISFAKYHRYVGDAADMAKIIRGEKTTDFNYEHDLAVQETVLRASGMPLT